MAVLLFPGQGSQSVGMGKDLFDASSVAKDLFLQADEILGFNLSDTMFNGTEEDLKKTSVTQHAVCVNAYIRFVLNKDNFTASAVAGHSLGELTALIANETISFEDGIKLVSLRAQAMQEACDTTEGTMAALLGLEDKRVEELCKESDHIVVAANYNCPGQLVISGTLSGVEEIVEKAKETGARRALMLPVNGAFHSPLMASAQNALSQAIEKTKFKTPALPIYQNTSAKAESDPSIIKENLIKQLTNSVRWTQTMHNMIEDGEAEFIEFGAKVLSGFIKKVDRKLPVTQY